MKKIILITMLLINTIMASELISNNYKSDLVKKRVDFINKKIESLKDLDKVSQLRKVNNFFNRYIRYTSDKKLYGKKNYIATLEETVLTMKGDCDDYVLAKTQALSYLGFKEMKLLFSTEKGIRHVKLIVKENNNYYVLDNLNKKFRLLKNKELTKKKRIKVYNGSLYLALADIRKSQA